MNRRGFVAGLGSLAMAPALPAQESRGRAGRMKITEVRLVRLKVVRGGISDVRKIGVLAEAFDRQVTPHCAIEEATAELTNRDFHGGHSPVPRFRDTLRNEANGRRMWMSWHG